MQKAVEESAADCVDRIWRRSAILGVLGAKNQDRSKPIKSARIAADQLVMPCLNQNAEVAP